MVMGSTFRICQNVFRHHGDPQMIQFGAHLVLVLRYLDEMKDPIRKELTIVGDHILCIYAMFLFSKQHEELVGIYASQLAHRHFIDLFVRMMELRLNGRNFCSRGNTHLAKWNLKGEPPSC